MGWARAEVHIIHVVISEGNAIWIRRGLVDPLRLHAEDLISVQVEHARLKQVLDVLLDFELLATALDDCLIATRVIAPVVMRLFPTLVLCHDLDGSRHMHAPMHARPQT